MNRVTRLDVSDVRFPTSRELDGSDAMNPDPDYSAAYVRLSTEGGETGHGLVFTIGRGNDVVANAVAALADHIVGRDADELIGDLGLLSRELIGDSQLRWLGPEKGVMHMAIGGVVNAVWDLAARTAGQPLWQFLAGMTPRQLVDVIDFRYLSDAITPDEALDLLTAVADGREERTATLLRDGYPAYTTSPGWLGYSDEKLATLAEQAIGEGFQQIKLKVGASLDDDIRRMGIAREIVGEHVRIATDANQRWDVPTAIAHVRRLQEFSPAWIEEPTSPDDILGHASIRKGVAPVPVATGEHVANRVVFKQLLQADAIDVVQIDASRVAGVNENLAILLLAAKFGVPVCPHAGGVGLCEVVQHLTMFDYIAVSASLEGRFCEFVDHLHEHFEHPAVVRDGRYVVPRTPGASAAMLEPSVRAHTFPDGAVWRTAQ